MQNRSVRALLLNKAISVSGEAWKGRYDEARQISVDHHNCPVVAVCDPIKLETVTKIFNESDDFTSEDLL